MPGILIMENSNQNGQWALNTLVNGVHTAQRRGAFTLQEAELLSRAIRFFGNESPMQSMPEPPKQEDKKKKKK